MRPKGQVSLVCDRKGILQTIDFLVVDVPGDKPPLLSGKAAQALEHLKIYADETNAIEDMILQTPQTPPPLGMLTVEDIVRQYAHVFRPDRGNPREGNPSGHLCILSWTLLLHPYMPQQAECPWQSYTG